MPLTVLNPNTEFKCNRALTAMQMQSNGQRWKFMVATTGKVLRAHE